MEIFKSFPKRVVQDWLPINKVHSILNLADYGLLIREDSITNQVASPTKFAEYLKAGLDVLISDNIGDFSEFVLKNSCGQVINAENADNLELKKLNAIRKEKNQSIFEHHYSTDTFSDKVLNLLNRYD